ncbi:uncharacterized protein LOC126607240 isoform X2 [Malus sylvestris]|uniref:uncharacterized protein LOC126607240 isoform X2 n=1 Tax=Malus sylvestris TaxID=3752 RepID=UPI0021AD15CD|nr:uncharacterized protein LOC126607240 isoform X2 [Malus sylvestris]
MRAQIDSREPPRCCSNLVAKHLFSPKVSFYFRLIWFSLNESKITRLEPVVSKKGKDCKFDLEQFLELQAYQLQK